MSQASHHGRGRASITKMLAALALSGALITVPGLGAVPTAAAAPTSLGKSVAAKEERITWAVEPATVDGPDGRHWVEQTLEPGQTATEYMAVRNFSRVDVTFRSEEHTSELQSRGHLVCRLL